MPSLVPTSILYNSKDKSGGVCGWANKHAKTSHGVSQDEGGGGGPALCNRLTPCFCWHGCLRVPGSTQTEEPGCPTTTHIWAVPALEGSRWICIFQSSSARACIQSARRARACIVHVDSGCQLDHAWRFWIIPVIERARVHSAGQPRARMHHACGSWMSVGSDHACGFWMSVGSDHACSNRARACIMHADYSTVTRARASCMQILHANSRCQLDQIMHKFFCH